MKKYLATLHQRSHHHKKRFALLVSGGFTLLIFSIWSLANFGIKGPTLEANEVSPLESLASLVLRGFDSIAESVDELRDEVLDTYGDR